MLKRILVTLDGSELAEQALKYAQDIVAPDGKLILLSVLDVPNIQVYTLYEVPLVIQEGDYDQFVENLHASSREYMDTLNKRLAESGIAVETVIEPGDPAEVILDQAQKLSVDAIVMSTHGRSGLSRWLFGSVTQKVLNAMPCPVFVVPGLVKEKAEKPETEPASDQNFQPA